MDEAKKQDETCPGTGKMSKLEAWVEKIMQKAGFLPKPPAPDVPIAECQCDACRIETAMRRRQRIDVPFTLPAWELADLEAAIAGLERMLRERCEVHGLGKEEYNAIAFAASRLMGITHQALRLAMATAKQEAKP